MTKKQRELVKKRIQQHCCCHGYYVHPHDDTKLCVIGGFMTPENRKEVGDSGCNASGYQHLPFHIKLQVERTTGLSEGELCSLQEANDSILGTEPDIAQQRREKVLKNFEKMK